MFLLFSRFSSSDDSIYSACIQLLEPAQAFVSYPLRRDAERARAALNSQPWPNNPASLPLKVLPDHFIPLIVSTFNTFLLLSTDWLGAIQVAERTIHQSVWFGSAGSRVLDSIVPARTSKRLAA
jgi:hypothetical protein